MQPKEKYFSSGKRVVLKAMYHRKCLKGDQVKSFPGRYKEFEPIIRIVFVPYKDIDDWRQSVKASGLSHKDREATVFYYITIPKLTERIITERAIMKKERELNTNGLLLPVTYTRAQSNF